ncbi:hypothetical protein C4561_01760 [candidate division WWE3 bacterium]|uniref:Calcineurin-like phosphoesterase domain-containing protein n=1 Tax=candidate division WWE3 bacterium TaxID=2053526 RepID=A0A3A4ZEP2_UNCKA|nr:MAG: hypothetical protein C4561_01760 [candidate division WWE3 bacterium]
MKFLLTADLHLRLNEPLGVQISDFHGFKINDRLADKFVMLEQMVATAIKHDVDWFVILGDLFDYPNPPEILRFLFFQAIAPLWEKKKISTLLLAGNHGTDDWQAHNLMSESWVSQGAFETMSTPFVKTFMNRAGEEIPIVGFPEMKPDVLDDWFVKLENRDPEPFAFGHLGLAFSKVEASDFRVTSGVEVTKFSRFKHVFLGDFHRPQELANCQYVGSPFIIDLGEIDYIHSYLVATLTSIGGWKSEAFVLQDPLSCEVRNIKIDSNTRNEDFMKLFAPKKTGMKEFLCLKLSIDKASASLPIVDFKKLQADLLNLGFYWVRFDFDFVDNKILDVDRVAAKAGGIDWAYLEYCKQHSFTEEVANYGRKIMGELRATKKAEN